MLELLALALLQFATLFSAPTTNAAGGSSGWSDGNVTASAQGGSSGWSDGNVTASADGGSSGWSDGNAR